jgi:hypothetical protein
MAHQHSKKSEQECVMLAFVSDAMLHVLLLLICSVGVHLLLDHAVGAVLLLHVLLRCVVLWRAALCSPSSSCLC